MEVHSTRHCHMERVHVRHRWAPHITVHCNEPSGPKIHVVSDELEERLSVNVALTASAPQTARANIRRYAPDYIRLGAPTRWPHEHRHITKWLHCRSCHHDLSCGQQHGRRVVHHTHTHHYTRPSTLQCVLSHTHTRVLTRYRAESASIPTTTARPRSCLRACALRWSLRACMCIAMTATCDGRCARACALR